VLENERVGEEFSAFRRKRYLLGRFVEKLHPEFVVRIGDEQPADAASHAVADHDHRLAQRETLLDSVQFMAQNRSGIGIRVTAWIGSCA
jgi:hypothetical protein